MSKYSSRTDRIQQPRLSGAFLLDRDGAIAAAKELGFTHIQSLGNLVPLDDWMNPGVECIRFYLELIRFELIGNYFLEVINPDCKQQQLQRLPRDSKGKIQLRRWTLAKHE